MEHNITTGTVFDLLPAGRLVASGNFACTAMFGDGIDVGENGYIRAEGEMESALAERDAPRSGNRRSR